jgi:integrase
VRPSLAPLVPLIPRFAGTIDTKPAGEPLARLIDLHRKNKLPTVAASTQSSYTQTYRLLGESLGTHPSVAQAGAWVSWLRERYPPPKGYTDSSTVHCHWKNARAVYEWAKEWGLVSGCNPFAVLNLRKPKPRARAIMDLAEFWPAIMGCCLDHRQRTLLLAARDLGLRRAELLGLLPQDIITTANPWHLRIERQRLPSSWEPMPPKTDCGSRNLPISAELKDALVQLLEEGPASIWFGQGRQRLVTVPWLFPYRNHELCDLRKRCGQVAPAAFPKGDWLHALRHTLAIYLMRTDATTDDIQRQLGHGSPTTTQQVYSRFDMRPVKAAPMSRALEAMQSGPTAWGAPPGQPGGGPEKRPPAVRAAGGQERSRQSSPTITKENTTCSTPSPKRPKVQRALPGLSVGPVVKRPKR